ncbi:MAG: ester cyclase [Gemmatimonadales bacterium]|jgi:limonene-1,2-epoxide hydrolase
MSRATLMLVISALSAVPSMTTSLAAQAGDRVAITKQMFTEGWMKHDGEAASKAFGPTATSYTNGSPDSVRGPEDVKQTVKSLAVDWPDFTIHVLDVRQSGDHVYTHWRFEGTHKSTHKKVDIQGMNDDLWHGNQIVEERSYFDFVPVLKSQGYTITPPADSGMKSMKK